MSRTRVVSSHSSDCLEGQVYPAQGSPKHINNPSSHNINPLSPETSINHRSTTYHKHILVIECLRYTKLCWVGKQIYNIMKPTRSPTQGQPNPRNIRLKVVFGPLFPTANNFSWIGIGLYRKQTTRNLTQPNPPRTP